MPKGVVAPNSEALPGLPGADLPDFISAASFVIPKYICDSAWLGHAPFALWLIGALRPRTLVELGTHTGFSYFTFCQAVQAFGAGGSCFAVDTWKGDEHAGFYGEEVFSSVQEYHNRHYASFSCLIRSTFDAAVQHFEDRAIDLLHIDGRHSYEDVSHDLVTWLPKLSDRAVVLLHDINVRERGFGVFRLWSELQKKYPHFSFLHGHGLGVVAVGPGIEERVQSLFAANSNEVLTVSIRQAYARLGGAVGDCLLRQYYTDLLATKDQHMAAKGEEVAARNSDIVALRDQLAELQAAIDARSTEFASLRGELASAQDRAIELEEARDTVSAQTRCLENRLETSQHQAARSEQIIKERSAAVERLEAGLETSQHKAVQLEQVIKERSAAIKGLESRLTDRCRHAIELSSALERKSVELEAVRRSASWRLTAPLRQIGAMFPWPVAQLRRLARLLRPSTLRLRLRERSNAALIAKSDLFDQDWYLQRYHDVRASKTCAARHYLQFGASEGRNPSPEFDGNWYLDQNPDVREAGVNPLLHYLRYGVKEGRRPKPSVQQTLSEAPSPPRRLRHQEPSPPLAEFAGWIAANEPSRESWRDMSGKEFSYQPVISIIVPVYKISRDILDATLRSIARQSYPHWQACVAYADLENDVNWSLIQAWTESDIRFAARRLEFNGGISANSNEALQLATGEFIALLDHDDELAPWALYSMVAKINEVPEADFLYSDKDLVSEDGSSRFQPLFKPEWSPEMLYSANYLTHLNVIRRSIVDAIGGFRQETDGAQDWDLFFRATERARRVVRVPGILYHWRTVSSSMSQNTSSKPYAFDGQWRAIADRLKRLGLPAVVERLPRGTFHIHWRLPPWTADVVVHSDRADAHQIDRLLHRLPDDRIGSVIVAAFPGSDASLFPRGSARWGKRLKE